MKQQLKIGEAEFEIEAGKPDAEGRLELIIGGQAKRIKITNISMQQALIEHDGRAGALYFISAPGGLWVWREGRARFVEEIESRRKIGKKSAKSGHGDITPPMPGLVKKIFVALNQKVKKGEPLVLLTAMKMEMTLSAPYDGTVTAINTEVGANVGPGAKLVELARES
jgi:biotin carboxyl carrier protein